jgi:flagellar biosynthesis/type III secretory pathway M-ring protein FliF/YscJ
VNRSEVIVGLLLAAGLLALALYFGWRQIVSLRRLRTADALPDEERHFERRKARLRLVSCALLLLMAGLLVGLQFYDAGRVQDLADKRERLGQEEPLPLTDQQKFFIKAYFGTWVALLIVLMIVLILAAMDLWATRRFGLRQYRKLSEDRRAMIQRQANRMRQERNGPT